MKLKNIKATSIAESLVIMLIVVTWVVWMYRIFSESTKLSNTTKNRIEAIQIAREWIEAMTNLRDTNWILYSADNRNCWNTTNYNNNCIWNTGRSTTVGSTDIWPWSYIIYKDSNDRWSIFSKTTGNYNTTVYKNDFKVTKDSDWFYTQTWWTEFKPVFTREMKITYPENTNWDSFIDSNDEKMKIISLVQWSDSSSEKAHKVELETILSNWKN